MSFEAVKWARSQTKPTQAKMLVLLDLAMYHDRERGAWPHAETLAENLNLSVGAVRRAITWLKTEGYISAARQRGRGRSAVYHLDLDFDDTRAHPSRADEPDSAVSSRASVNPALAHPYRADEITPIVKEEQVVKDNSGDTGKVVAMIQRDWWRFVREQTGRYPTIATTERGSVMAFKTVITPFVESGVPVFQLKQAIRSMWERGRSLSVQSLDAELSGRQPSQRSGSTAKLAAVKFDDEGNVVA